MTDDRPPSYQESTVDAHTGEGWKSSEKQPWSLDDQAAASRSWLAIAAAEKACGLLEQRAMCGVFRTMIVLVPQGQDCALSGDFRIVEFEDKPATIELVGDGNSVEFWSQVQAIEELRRQIARRIGGRSGRLRVELDSMHIRNETRFGLYETKQMVAIMVSIE